MKKTKITLVIVLLISIFLFSGVYASANEMKQESPQKQDAKKLHEIEDMRTLNSKAYAMSDGAIQHEIFATNINYKDSDGKLKEIDITVNDIDSERNQGFKFKNGANDWDVYFADKGKNQDMVKIKKNKYSISFSMNEIESTVIASKSTNQKRGKSELHDHYVEDPTIVIYNDIQLDIDLAYTIREGYLKEDIILNKKPARNEFSFDIKVQNLKLVLKDNTLLYCDAKTGEAVSRSMNLFMEDSAGNISNNVSMKLDNKNTNHYTLTIQADEQFLNDINTVYPVVIDPTIDMYNSTMSISKDTYVSSVNPSAHYYSSDYLRTGNDGTSSLGTRRTFIQFSIPTVINNKQIYEASLELLVRTHDGNITNRAYMITEDNWSVTATDWDDQPTTSTLYKSSPCTFFDWGDNGSDWLTMDVTGIVTRWAGGYDNNNGFMVKDDVETNPDVWATMYSSNYSTAYKRPRLTITYYPTVSDWNREVIGVYGGNFSDNDVHLFCNALTGLPTPYVDARYSYLDSDPERLIEADNYDVLYWSGHGYYSGGSAWLSYGLKENDSTPGAGDNYTFDACDYIGNDWVSGYTNIRSNSQLNLDIEYAFFASCNIIRSELLSQWTKVMAGYPNRVRIIHGYNGTAPSGDDDNVVTRYFYNADSMTSINAWLESNDYYNEPGTAIAHYNNRNDHLVGFGSNAGNPSNSSAVDVRFYDLNDYVVSSIVNKASTVSKDTDDFNVMISSELPTIDPNKAYSSSIHSTTNKNVEMVNTITKEKGTKIKHHKDNSSNIHISDILFEDGKVADYDRSLQIVYNYIQKTFGIKGKALILDSVKTIRMMNEEQTTNVAYIFRFANSINGIPVSTEYGNNLINIIVDSNGISNICLKWDNFEIVEKDKKQDVILNKSEDALALVLEDMRKYKEYYSTVEPVKIVDVHLAYSTNVTNDSTYQLVWEFSVENKPSIQVDVYNGTIFNPLNPKN